MFVTSEGIVLRQVKTAGGKRMILIFTKQYGKISAGTNLNEKGRNKSALSIRPFTYGNYEFYKNKDYFNLNNGQVEKTFFAIGEDLDKYFLTSYVLELTEKLLPEEMPQPRVFALLLDFLHQMEKREKKHETLVLAYETKVLKALGVSPVIDKCVCCGSEHNLKHFSIKDGGMICSSCRGDKVNETLIYSPKFDIIGVLDYFTRKPIEAFSKIALDDDTTKGLWEIYRDYLAYHLDIKELKSDSLMKW